MIYHSVGGSTGSAISAAVMKEIRAYFGPKKVRFSNMLFPSPQFSNSMIEPYNAIYGLSEMCEYVDAVTMFDNEAMYRICEKQLGIPDPSFAEVNSLIA